MPYGSTENVRVKGSAQRFSLIQKSLIDRALPEDHIPMEFPSQANGPLGSRINSGFRVQARETKHVPYASSLSHGQSRARSSLIASTFARVVEMRMRFEPIVYPNASIVVSQTLSARNDHSNPVALAPADNRQRIPW